jgi:hypothetical protein
MLPRMLCSNQGLWKRSACFTKSPHLTHRVQQLQQPALRAAAHFSSSMVEQQQQSPQAGGQACACTPAAADGLGKPLLSVAPM